MRLLSPVLALAAASAFAVYPNNGPDTTYTSVLSFSGASGVAIDARWVLTAQHVGAPSTIQVGSTVYNVIGNFEPAVIGNRRPDLRLLQVDADLPSFTRIDVRAPLLGTVDIVGYGSSGVETSFGYDFPGRPEDAQGVRRRATNRIEGFADIHFDPNGNPPSPQYPAWTTMYFDLTAPGGEGRTAQEGGLQGGDSGGGFFHDFGDGGGPRLVAINSAIGTYEENQSQFFFGQGVGFGVYLGDGESQAFLQQYVPQAMVPEPATFAALGLGALAMLRRRKR